MRFIIIGLMVILSFIAKAQDTTKVLFVGNSFTSANNLHILFEQLAHADGKEVVVASHAPGGVSVGDISQGTSAHSNNPVVYSLIKSQDWDYLVLQDNQGRFCLSYGQFPQSSLVIEGHLQIRDSLLFYHPCAKMIWFAGFATKDGYPPYGNSAEALIDSLYHNYQYLNDIAKQIIAPIGPAFKRIIFNHPSIDLGSSDKVHPSLSGSYLTANVIFSTVFKTNPLSSNYNPGLSSSVDSILKTIAFQTTIDSIATTGMQSITPEISHIGNTLTINGYLNCQWFLNDFPVSASNCALDLLQTGNYHCIATDSNGCAWRSLAEVVDLISPLSDNPAEKEIALKVYPNPAFDELTIIAKPESEIRIYNSVGQLVVNLRTTQSREKIELTNFADGFYFLYLMSDKTNQIQRFIVQRNL
ncbi:MAG: T9SS type A sorting domain-containing protein [Bacteroidales bacterium]|nr:T9SS type A sorting domain-containing protein [Bacteroidales bacterium]